MFQALSGNEQERPLDHDEQEGESRGDNVVATLTYVKELAHELAELADSAGCIRLSKLLTLASQEARLCHFNFTWESTKL
jgi:hypothetical protein